MRWEPIVYFKDGTPEVPSSMMKLLLIARRMREQDRREVMASHHWSPTEAVMESVEGIVMGGIIIGDDDIPAGVAGISPEGCVWLLATDGLLATASHRRQFIRGARVWLDQGLARLQEWRSDAVLWNWVYATNLESVQWLISLGFTVHQPEPHGPSCQLFRYFERRA